MEAAYMGMGTEVDKVSDCDCDCDCDSSLEAQICCCPRDRKRIVLT